MVASLRVGTAVSIKLGPFVDATDGFTAETALTISQADVRLAKNDANWAQKNETTSATHEENGWYEVPLDATDTNTLGRLVVAVNETGARPVYREYMVVPANVYDSFVANTDFFFVDTVQVEGLDASEQITNRAFDALAVYDGPTHAELISEVDTIPDALLDHANGVESGLTLRQFLKVAVGPLFGISFRQGLQRVYMSSDNAKERVRATVSNGDRTVVVLDKS